MTIQKAGYRVIGHGELGRLYRKDGLTSKELAKVKRIKLKEEKIENKARHNISICELIFLREKNALGDRW